MESKKKKQKKKVKKSITICLNMIVKNESKVITRCFETVKDYIDYWVICDTGSTDGTQDIIRKYFEEHEIKGELHEVPWVNFGHNRSQSISLAKDKADYILLLDGDHELVVNNPVFKKQKYSSDIYMVKNNGVTDYSESRFVKGDIEWCYKGVTHEYLDRKDGKNTTKDINFTSLTVTHRADGGSRHDKFERDIRLLTQGLIDEPTNERYMFYLANSYRDTRQFDNAIKYYKLRVLAGGFREEVYIAQYQIGLCRKYRGDDFFDYMGDLLKAYHILPSRLEALYEIVDYCHNNTDPTFDLRKLGANLGILAINNVYPKEQILFINRDIHEWKFWFALSICCYYAGYFDIGKKLCLKLLKEKKYPERLQQRMEENFSFFKDKV